MKPNEGCDVARLYHPCNMARERCTDWIKINKIFLGISCGWLFRLLLTAKAIDMA